MINTQASKQTNKEINKQQKKLKISTLIRNEHMKKKTSNNRNKVGNNYLNKRF